MPPRALVTWALTRLVLAAPWASPGVTVTALFGVYAVVAAAAEGLVAIIRDGARYIDFSRHVSALRSTAQGREMKQRESDELLRTLEARFAKHMHRHESVSWDDVRARLEGNDAAMKALHAMETTGGEPDVLGAAGPTGHVTFVDCSLQSPSGRRSICYDGEARRARKEHKPRSSAVEMAAEMGIRLLSEEQYRALQQLGDFDTKTSSWIETPPDVRSLGGALFCDRRFGKVFVYHNGAESYYAARGFRGFVRV